MTHINQRRDYAAVWTSENPVLPLGQVGWERDTDKAKLGDGVTAWNDLDYAVFPGPVLSVAGDTGHVVLAKADVGLSNVDNTSDASKPVSTAQAAAIAAKASLASPAFTGTPTAPTPSGADDSTKIATTEWVRDLVASLLLSAHPVGSIYTSVSNTNPAGFLGGTWVAFGAGRTLIGVDSLQTEFDTVEETGGDKEVSLVAANLPRHKHGMNHGHQSRSTSTDGGSTLAFRRSDNTSVATGGGMVENFTGNTAATIIDTSDTELPATVTPVNKLPPYVTVYFFKRTA